MAAMSAKAVQWQTATVAFADRLVDHADGLRSSAIGFQQTEDRDASDIQSVAAASHGYLGSA